MIPRTNISIFPIVPPLGEWCDRCFAFHAPARHYPTFYVMVDGVDVGFIDSATKVVAENPEQAVERALRQDGELWSIVCDQNEDEDMIAIVSLDSSGSNPVFVRCHAFIALHTETIPDDEVEKIGFDTYERGE